MKAKDAYQQIKADFLAQVSYLLMSAQVRIS